MPPSQPARFGRRERGIATRSAARGERRILLLQMLLAAGRAAGLHRVRRAAHQFLELVSTGFATIFVDRHSYTNIIAPDSIRSASRTWPR